MTDFSPFDELYARARAGDPAAQSDIQRVLGPRLDRYVQRQLGMRLLARVEPEDVSQTAFLRFLQRLAQFPERLDESQALAYLLQLARWAIRDLCRDEADVQPLASSVAAPVASRGPVTRDDERRWTREQICALPERYREVMKLHYCEGRDLQAIGIELGIEHNLVKQRLARGRALIRELTGPESPDHR
ncbi:MAG: sigma-70 family RNA polymerase sigma factor [Planctomycetes bacterium]|nr:sigma-70 family RNA polymerase sigma factor [Planctomycetota bacterium]